MDINDVSLNTPLYMYQMPMFMITVSNVVVVENGVLVVKDEDGYRFLGGAVKAGRETIQFASIKYVKEQSGLLIKKGELIPVDFRSGPERSPEGNVVDIGMVVMPEDISVEKLDLPDNTIWSEVDFEKKKFTKEYKLMYDHGSLLERAIDGILMMKE